MHFQSLEHGEWAPSRRRRASLVGGSSSELATAVSPGSRAPAPCVPAGWIWGAGSGTLSPRFLVCQRGTIIVCISLGFMRVNEMMPRTWLCCHIIDTR